MDITANRNINELHDKLGWYIALAIGIMALGILAIIAPLAATFAFEQLAGIAFTIGGIIMVVHAFRWKLSERFFFSLILGLFYLAFGIYLLVFPLGGVFTLTAALAIFFFAVGLVKIINAFRIRPSSQWGWLLLSGLISIVLSVLIWAGMPLSALWVIGVIVGIDLLFFGLAMLMLMLAVRKSFEKKEPFCIGGDCYTFS